MKDIKACFSKNSDDWATPSSIYKTFLKYDFIDPCPFKASSNGFGAFYYYKRIYINPPFSKNKYWVQYACDLALNNDVWLLIACRTDTVYFRKLVDSFPSTIYFITGRISFNDKGLAPFPVMFIHLNTLDYRYYSCTQDEFISIIDELYK